MEYAQKVSSYLKQRIRSSSLSLQYYETDLEYHSTLQSKGFYDPIGDLKRFVAPQLIHRYSNRALFTPTFICPVNCRFCFRKNTISNRDPMFEENFDKTLQYLKNHLEINEIIFTGGDPLILSKEKIEFYLNHFENIPSIQFIRFHTRMPCADPDKISTEYLEMMAKFQKRFQISLMVHVNHSDELFPEVKACIQRIQEHRINVYSQTVLLKGINDSVEALKELFINLAKVNIIPYYLHHPDKVKGAMHFYLTPNVGLEIFEKLKKSISGWMCPRYVIDSEEGVGKIPVARLSHSDTRN